jgi:hypothetical protein
MNTGDKNTKGRAILKGPRGGLYVIGPSGAKLSTFKKAPAAAAHVAPPPTRSVLNLAKAHMNTLKTAIARKVYVRTRSSNMTERNWVALGRYRNTLNYRASAARAAKKAGGAPAPAAAARVATPPRATNTIKHKGSTYTSTNVTVSGLKVYKKAGAGTYYTMSPSGTPTRLSVYELLTKPNRTTVVLRNYKKTNGVTAPASAAPRPTVAATARITTAERNVRLAAIRARLNAMRAAKLAAMPKRRANVDKRLKNVLAGVRARLRGNNPTTSTMTVPFCHAPASVPRKPCKVRRANISVYNSPMVADGTMLATRASDIDLDWFKRQDTYVKNLSDYDFWTAQAHTNRSHSWIGPFLYRGTVPSYLPGTSGKHIAPLWPQVRKMILEGTYTVRGTDRWRDAWIEEFKRMTSEKSRYDLFCNNSGQLTSNVMRKALEMYRDDLKRIIAGAPKSRKKMVLYRGASFDIFRSTKGHWHNLESFCSAAYDLKHALGYEGGTMQRITVLPGTPVLLVAGMNQWNAAGEYEIMVNMGTKYLIRGRGVKRLVWTGHRRMTRVTDVTIAK